MAIVSDAHAQFERFVLRVAGDDAANYNVLMSGRMRDFVRIAEAWLERLLAHQEQARKRNQR